MAMQFNTAGDSQSFPDGLSSLPSNHDGVIVAGREAGDAYRNLSFTSGKGFIAVELGHECLAIHTGLLPDERHLRTVGFARFRLGNADPSQLIEIVRQPWTAPDAISAVRKYFDEAGFKTAVCEDVPGRIVNRLIRPYFNAVLRRLDQKLASADDMDETLRLGLGYPEGPNALLERAGLEHHYDVTQALYIALGDPDFAPARAARVAHDRAHG
jgi:3-hydroxybutyryl-CoA dehydrogenase